VNLNVYSTTEISIPSRENPQCLHSVLAHFKPLEIREYKLRQNNFGF